MTLRILQVATGVVEWGGIERHISELSPLLAARGHNVTVACKPHSEIERRALLNGLPVINLSIRKKQDWKEFLPFLTAIRGTFDVVHIHHYLDYLVPAVASRLAGTPAIIMSRHTPHPFRNRVIAYAGSAVFCDAIIAVSGFVREILLNSGVQAARVHVVHNGIEVQTPTGTTTTLRKDMGIDPHTFVVVAAGRLWKDKGFDTLIRAIGLARKRGLEIICLIAGQGGMLSELEALRESEILASTVRFLGFRDDVPALYSMADVVAVPSDWDDPLPYTAVEGLACGKPVVASMAGGIPEIVTDECGILVPRHDPERLAEALETLALNPELRERLGTQARRRATLFGMDAMVNGVEAVYLDVLRTRRPSGFSKQYEDRIPYSRSQ